MSKKVANIIQNGSAKSDEYGHHIMGLERILSDHKRGQESKCP